MRPLVKRAPDGRLYAVPTEPQHREPEPTRQPASGAPSVPEPTPRRGPRGLAKLTAEDVRAIRADYAAGKWSQSDLAYIHGVSQHTIYRVVNGAAHIGPTPTEQDS